MTRPGGIHGENGTFAEFAIFFFLKRLLLICVSQMTCTFFLARSFCSKFQTLFCVSYKYPLVSISVKNVVFDEKGRAKILCVFPKMRAHIPLISRSGSATQLLGRLDRSLLC
jgi:hypothetical protein